MASASVSLEEGNAAKDPSKLPPDVLILARLSIAVPKSVYPEKHAILEA